MNVAVQVQDNITPTLAQMADQFPRDFWRGMHSASKWAVKRIRTNFALEQAANARLAPLSQLTKELRDRRVASLLSRKQRVKERGQSLRWVRFNRVLKSGKLSKRTQRMRVQPGYLPMQELREESRSVRRGLEDATRLGGKLGRLFEYQINEANWMVRIGWVGKEFPKSQVSGLDFQQSSSRPFTKQERAMMHRRLRAKVVATQYQKPMRSTIAPYEFDPEMDSQFRATVWKTIQNLSKWRASQGAAQVSQ